MVDIGHNPEENQVSSTSGSRSYPSASSAATRSASDLGSATPSPAGTETSQRGVGRHADRFFHLELGDLTNLVNPAGCGPGAVDRDRSIDRKPFGRSLGLGGGFGQRANP